THPWMSLPNALHHLHQQVVFGCSLPLPLLGLIVRLAADAKPATGCLLTNLAVRCCSCYDFLPKFFLRSSASAWLATSRVVCSIRFSSTLSAKAASSSAMRSFIALTSNWSSTV